MNPVWRAAYVAVGSNLDEPLTQATNAFERLARIPAVRLECRSSFYLTDPMGPQDQPLYVNAVAGLLTRLPARALLDELLDIERAMGRTRTARWGPRIIDLDLVWMIGAPIDEAGLTLPHPGVSARNFVLYPLNDIAPTLHIPGHGKVADLKARVSDGGISRMERC